jgi:phage FluMu gp28-like protein
VTRKKQPSASVESAKSAEKIGAPSIVSSESYFLSYQDKWIDDAAPFKLAEKSRRVGFTYATSYRCFQKCMRRERFTQWVSSRDLLTAKEFVTDYIARWCRLGNVVARGIAGDNVEIFGNGDIKAFVVDFPTGSRIVSLSSTPEVFAGKGGDVLLDELDLHQDAGRVYDMARPCTTWGGQLEAISAYAVDGSPSSVFARLCQDARGANPMKASLHRVTLDDAISAGFVECVNRVTGSNHTRESFRALIRAGCRTEAAFQSQYMCNPQDDGGALLPYQLIYACEATPEQIASAVAGAPDAPNYMGIDVGRKHDLAQHWVGRRIGDVLWIHKVRAFAKTLFRDQFAAACEAMDTFRVRRCCIDATGIGAQLGEDLKLRYRGRVEEIQFTHASQVDIGMSMLPAFQDRAVRIPSDQTIREGLHKVRKTVTAANQVRLEAASDEAGHADEFWGCALCLHASEAKSAYFAPRPFRRRGALTRRADRRNAWKELAA